MSCFTKATGCWELTFRDSRLLHAHGMNSSERIATVIDSLGGIATRRQLVDKGFFGPQLTAAVRWGAIRRLRRGWYATASANPDAAIAVRIGGRLSHTSAARVFDLWAGLDNRIHVTVTQGASRLRKLSFELTSPVVIHWVLPGRQQLTAPTTWRVSLDECLLGVVRFCDSETAIACLSMAMSVYGFTSDELTLLFARESAESRRRAAQAREGSDSGTESVPSSGSCSSASPWNSR